MRSVLPLRSAVSARAAAVVCAVGLAATACSSAGDEDGSGQARSPASAAPSEEPESAEPSDAASPSDDAAPSPSGQSEATGPAEPTVVATAASGLEAPWGLDFLPDGSALVTERDSTRVLHLTPRGGGPRFDVREVATIDQAAPRGESGLLGVAVSPSYADDQQVFLYVSTSQDNRVLRGRFDGTDLSGLRPILPGIPNGFIHDGGRLEFGPDGYLYVSTGEIGQPSLAQDRGSLGGKILRITTDGEAAPGNPRGSRVWTLGHRNVQGLAFDGRDRLWASEFGQDTWDELNRIEEGTNYGWPAVEGKAGSGARPAFQDPARQWATSEASPSGLAYADGSLWMAALRGNRLWQVPVREDGGTGRPVPHLVGDYGRLRTVALAPDGRLWVTTSNRDGRGDPARQDDRILVVATGS